MKNLHTYALTRQHKHTSIRQIIKCMCAHPAINTLYRLITLAWILQVQKIVPGSKLTVTTHKVSHKAYLFDTYFFYSAYNCHVIRPLLVNLVPWVIFPLTLQSIFVYRSWNISFDLVWYVNAGIHIERNCFVLFNNLFLHLFPKFFSSLIPSISFNCFLFFLYSFHSFCHSSLLLYFLFILSTFTSFFYSFFYSFSLHFFIFSFI